MQIYRSSLKRQHGQAMIEYIVALSAVFMIFYISGGIIFQSEKVPCLDRTGKQVSPRDCLIDNMRGYYQGHSYALSLSEYPVSLPGDDIPSEIGPIIEEVCKSKGCELPDVPSLPGIPGGFPPSFDDVLESLSASITVTIGTILSLFLPEDVVNILPDALIDVVVIDIPIPP